VTLGGLGTITNEEYFAGAALYHMFGLGIGMMIFYLLVKSSFSENFGEEVAGIMYITGLFSCFCIIRFYIADWSWFVENKSPVFFQSDNNLATFLMFVMPFPLLKSSTNKLHLISFLLMFFCTVISGSRGGLLMGRLSLLSFCFFMP